MELKRSDPICKKISPFHFAEVVVFEADLSYGNIHLFEAPEVVQVNLDFFSITLKGAKEMMGFIHPVFGGCLRGLIQPSQRIPCKLLGDY